MQSTFSMSNGPLGFQSYEDTLLESPAGRSLIRSREEQQRSYLNSQFNYPPDTEAAINELCDVAVGSASYNWDGEGAAAVEESTLYQSCRFVLSLPRDCTMPESAADTDGELNLSWIGEKGHRLSLSIGPTGRISYAFRKGARRRNGTLWFTEHIDPDLLGLILTF